MKPNPKCHPNREHYGFGLCHPCYSLEWRYRTKYGLTLELYEEMVDTQGGLCLICDLPPRGRWSKLVVDHNHETGEIRGLLCHHCNLTVGQIEEQGPLFVKAQQYLDRFSNES